MDVCALVLSPTEGASASASPWRWVPSPELRLHGWIEGRKKKRKMQLFEGLWGHRLALLELLPSLHSAFIYTNRNPMLRLKL